MDITIQEDLVKLEQRQETWLTMRLNAEAADRSIKQEIEATVATYTRKGNTLLSAETVADYEARLRAQFDEDSAAEGLALAKDRQTLIERIAEAARYHEPLRAPVAMVAPATDKMVLAGILDELQLMRVRSDLTNLTRAELLDTMATWTDETHSPFLRTVEAAVLDGTLSRLGIRDDRDNPKQDVMAIPRLQQAVADRRAKRVPAWLHEAGKRAQALGSMRFTTALDHLRSGRGVANRPGLAAIR